jgi:hypothetical protein
MTRALHRPNLFIIGAMKSGTTSLHEYLDTHPQIAMSETKEPGYFVEELSLAKGEAWYLSLFNQDDRFRYRGESSTHYTKLPVYRGVADRLHRFNPDARLIYIMRDPFERLVSHYWHNVRDVVHGGELRPLLKAVKERPDYLAFSDYAMQLAPYLDRFGRQALYTLTFEALIDDPQREFDRLCQWLGLPPAPIARDKSTAHNQKPKSIAGVAGLGLLNRIEYSNVWDRVSPYVPVSFKEWAKRRAYTSVDERATERSLPELRAEIGEPLRRRIESLSRLLGRAFPEWEAARPAAAARAALDPR